MFFFSQDDCCNYDWKSVEKYNKIFRQNHYTFDTYSKRFSKRWIDKWNTAVTSLLKTKEVTFYYILKSS